MQIFENFISYRRNETPAEVQNIYYVLNKKGYSTFCDIYSLDSGRFDNNLKDFIERCTNFILVINNHSLDRCVEEDDWLRFEIRIALELNKNIICIFVGDVDFPEHLPEDINSIRFYNSVKYDFNYFDSFIEVLCSRFLLDNNEAKISDSNRDFLITDGVLLKYLGDAPVVIIPDGVREIGSYAFKDKTRITDITFPKGLECICEHSFERCINITSLIFPSSLKKIGNAAFLRCYSLSYVGFNDELLSIGEETFGFCGRIKVIRFGKSIANIPSSAFNDCDKLAIIDVSKENGHYSSHDGILYNKEITSLIRCPEGCTNDLVTIIPTVEKLSSWCFSKCLNLVDIVLPKHLKEVGAYAFNDCHNIISLTLGDEIESFDVTALEGWDSRQRIVVSRRFNSLLKYKIEQKINEYPVLSQENGSSTSEYVMIKTTFESVEEASKMAKMLINYRYIASAQIDRLNVFYTWNGEACNEDEIELSCITRGGLYNTVESFIKHNHSYECCQIICIPIINLSEEFSNWINEQTKE